jgi:hypothetical protein
MDFLKKFHAGDFFGKTGPADWAGMGPRTAGLGLETQKSAHFEPGKPDSPGFFS